MVEINNSKDLRKWLEGKPREYSMVIASRIALRVLPFVGGIYNVDFPKKIQTDLTKTIFRTNLISWVAGTASTHDIRFVASGAANASYTAARGARDSSDVANAAYATDAARAASGAANASYAAARAARGVADTAVYADDSYYATDVDLLEQDMKPKQLAKRRLWHSKTPSELNKEWQGLNKNLLALNQDWEVWIDWYEDILLGRNWAGLPDDLVEQLSLKIAKQTDEWWEQDSVSINADIKKWRDEAKAEASERNEVANSEPEPQNAGAIRFSSIEGEPIGIDSSGNDELLDDEGATNRHSEVKRLVNLLLLSCDSAEGISNSAAQLIDEVKNYQQSLGDEPKQAKIDFLIPRGDGLRMMLEAQENIDVDSNLSPISDKHKLALGGIVKAHNVYVSLDPALAKRDGALLGPDAKTNLIAPADGMKLIKDAAEAGIAKPEIAEALGEEAKVAPKTPDAENRKSRRYSEGVKNFARKVAADVHNWTIEQTNKHKAILAKGAVVASAGVTISSAGIAVGVVATYLLGLWMLKKEKWFRNNFSKNKVMVPIIDEIFAILKKLPLE